MNLKKYYIITVLIALIVSPVIMNIGFFIGFVRGMDIVAAIVLSSLLLIIFWFLYSRFVNTPEKISELLLPVLIAFCYYLVLWIIIFSINIIPGKFNEGLYGVYTLLALPNIIANICVGMMGDYTLFPIINAGPPLIAAWIIILSCIISGKKIIPDKKILVYAAIVVGLSGIAAGQIYYKNTSVLGYDYQTVRIEDEVNLWEYQPFGYGENNKLKRMSVPPEIIIDENYPKLDGATAAYPVYAAMVQAIYKGLDAKTVGNYVECSGTGDAYNRLINGEIDVFFGAQPSKQQIQAAQDKGVEFILTPIAKEAFVFFVNKSNPVDSLTLEQIQDIYQKKITNWKSVGGKSEKITPFQRPENSGSQTIMLAAVMGDKSLPKPLREEYATGMGGIINRVAEYRNYSSAIGYSFRYFATGMKPAENIKILAVDGVHPTVENIKNGSYVFTIDVYAVTVGVGSADKNKNTDALINWVLSEQGQNFIEICGYVGYAGN